jgi:hypothetical protein
LIELEENKFMLKGVDKLYKNTEASEYFSRAFEIMKGRS